MMIPRIVLVLLLLLPWVPLRAAEVYDARVAEGEILTPAPAKAPRINGPKVYGARPGRQFLYRIPAQGERPMRFAVDGLPEGLALDADRGILTGTVPDRRGEHVMTFSAENDHGAAQRSFTLVVGDTLALTPPAGWNHWGGHASNINDGIIRAAADLFVERGLADVGFQYVGIDDCWMRMEPAEHERVTSQPDGVYMRKHEGIDFSKLVGETRAADGTILTNADFPDMKALVDHIHGHGLKAGIYSSPGPKTCQHLEGSHGHQRQDAMQYAEWGFDLLKYDQCTAGGLIRKAKQEDPDFHPRDFWRPMIEYLAETDRDFVFNLCQYGQDDPWTWAPGIGVNMWRIKGDLNHHPENYFAEALRIATELRGYNGPGHWNDPDFIYVGRQVQTRGNHFVESSPTGLTGNQEYQWVTLWAMVCAPFTFSTDVLNASDFTIGLLSNADVMAVSQDELGHTAEVVRDDDSGTVLVKKLADGSFALALFNRHPDDEKTVSVDWDEFGECCAMEVFDVWRQVGLGVHEPGITVRLSPHGVALLRVRE